MRISEPKWDGFLMNIEKYKIKKMIIYNIMNKKHDMIEEYSNKQNITNTKRFFFKKGSDGFTSYIKKGSNDTREPTHRLFDGGNLHIKKEDMDEFFIENARDMVSGQKNYITELRTPIFKYFMDLDIYDEFFYSGKSLFKIITKIQTALSFFFERHDFDSDVYVCTTPPKNVKKDEEEYIKTGVHLIWPFIHVTQEIALFLRQFVIQYLEEKIGARPVYNSWDDVIDESVYNQNGLRMIGSYKATICKICKNKEPNKLDSGRFGCNVCFGIGRNLGIHTYTLTYIISTNKTIKKKLLKTVLKKQSDMMKTLSIQTIKLKSNINIEEPYPSWFNINLASKRNTKVVGQMLKKTRFQKNICGKKCETIDESDIVESIKTFINSTFGRMNHYKKIGIKTIRKSTSAKKECYWVSTDSTYCLNVNRAHTSAEIYFEIDYDRMTQRCFSVKNATYDREDGLCKNFKSKKSFPLNVKLKKKLFPVKFEENNNKQKSISGGVITKGNEKADSNHTLKNLMNTSSKLFEEVSQYIFESGNIDGGEDSDIN